MARDRRKVRRRRSLAPKTVSGGSRKIAKLLLKILDRTPPMQREAVLASEIDRMLQNAMDSAMNLLMTPQRIRWALNQAHPGILDEL